MAQAVPGPLARGIAGGIGPALAAAFPERRRMVERHLQRAHGGRLSPAALRGVVARSFASYARYWVESFRTPSLDARELDHGMAWQGIGHLERACAAGKGGILAIPHLGGWDYGGAWLATVGFPLTVVVEPLEPPELFDWFASFRRRLGMTVVPLGPSSGTTVLRALRANQLVALLCDRDIAGGGVDVEFFGERTTLPAGPVTLALRLGAPVMPTAVYFDGPWHLGVVGEPIPLVRRGRLRDDVARGTAVLAGELERLIKRAPEQWHLMQPNWPSDVAG